jgi:hypothetical protein
MPYQQIRGRRPYERASKIAHIEIINNPAVEELLTQCELPEPPDPADIQALQVPVPKGNGRIRTVIAIDGGLNETFVRPEFPSASIAFIALGPLLLYLDDLKDLDARPFIGPEDMQRLKKIQRYSLALPTRGVLLKNVDSFAHGVRKAIHDFLLHGDGHLYKALEWLLARGWRAKLDRVPWEIPRCPFPDCHQQAISFRYADAYETTCPTCARPVYLADGLRLYERIDEETGAGGILAYLLTGLEHIVLVHVIKTIWEMKRALLHEVLFIKDGPLAFFGVTAPLYRPMRDLMEYLSREEGGPYINLVGLEKSGPFVDHAAQIEDSLGAGQLLMLTNGYIYKHIEPGDPGRKQFGKNTYYGSKAIFRANSGETYVVSVPTDGYKLNPTAADLINGGEVLATVARLHCSMYDNALVPVVLANRLVSLADVPSARILEKFAKDRVAS